MARFVDLDDSDDDSAYDSPRAYAHRVIAAARAPSQPVQPAHHDSRPEDSDSVHASVASFAAALTCYPYATTHAIHRALGSQDHLGMLTSYTVSPFRFLLISI